MATKELWMQKALRRKPGALHRQLGIPKAEKIPATLMTRIQAANTGDVIANPTKVGKRKYKVTTLMQRRVNPVLTTRKFRHSKRRRGRLIH